MLLRWHSGSQADPLPLPITKLETGREAEETEKNGKEGTQAVSILKEFQRRQHFNNNYLKQMIVLISLKFISLYLLI